MYALVAQLRCCRCTPISCRTRFFVNRFSGVHCMLECPSCQEALHLNAHFCTHCGVHLSIVVTNSTPPTEPYAHEKCQLAERSVGIMGSMVSLLPFVYEDRRTENQALFASTIARALPLEDPAW